MDAEELRQLQALEDPVTVYRGVTPHNARNIRALSWTLDRDTAEWFAHRFGEDGTVYEAQIAKAHILAVFLGRNEWEVVVDPKYLEQVQESPVQDMGMEGMEMLDRDRLREILLLTEPEDWRAFQAAAEAGTYRPKKSADMTGLVLQRCGYLNRFQEGERVIYVVPEDVRSVYRELAADGFCRQKERADLIHAYAMAAVNLYGVIPLDDLIQIFNSQNGKMLDEKELFPVLIRHIPLECGYALWEKYLVNDAFEENSYRDVPDLLARIGNKPRYIPTRSEFLKYADLDYCEETVSRELLRQILLRDAEYNRDLAEEILSEIHFAIVLEARPQQLFDILRDYEVPIPGGDIQFLIDILSEMCNSTRLWSNNGHTPEELFGGYERQRLKKQPARAVKVGRNEPCPCGSGKKYKKCCGR